MTIAKRIFLFLAVNIVVVFTLSVILALFNVRPYLTQYGVNYTELLIFCLIWGMGGAFISLALSRVMAKWLMGVKVINPETSDPALQSLLTTVYSLAKKAKLPGRPEVGIFTSAEANAFATGPTKRKSLVAVSTGLLDKMDQGQLEAILAHEIAHIANGDMVTMTLIQGIVNAFVMFLARALALLLSGFGRGENKRGSFGSYYFLVMIFQLVFMVLGSMIVLAFSRWREYRADAGGAKLAGKEKMISALEGFKVQVKQRLPVPQNPAFDTLQITCPPKRTLTQLFLSHPPLEMRIARLKNES